VRFSSRSSFAPYNVAISCFAILFIGFALEWNRSLLAALLLLSQQIIKAKKYAIEDHRESVFEEKKNASTQSRENVRRDVSSRKRHNTKRNEPKNAGN
jgi:hypothetical protein